MKYREPSMPTDQKAMTEYIERLAEDFPEKLSVGYLGRSLCGRAIPLLTIGDGDNYCLYVGAHHASEHITASILLYFIRDALSSGAVFPCRIVTVPCLNPDGVELEIHGARDGDPMKERQIKINGGDDFTHWQANARGVDLNHNYDAGFWEYKDMERSLGIFGAAPSRYAGEFPESEPESGRLANYLRFNDDLTGVLTLHTQGEEIYTGAVGNSLPAAYDAGCRAASLINYELKIPSGSAAYGGLTDWVTSALGRPSLTVECGRGENPLPSRDFQIIYERIRPLLFGFPDIVSKRAVE